MSQNLYAWKNATYNIIIYTKSETPSVGDSIYKADGTEYAMGEVTDGTFSYQNHVAGVAANNTYIQIWGEK